MRQGVQFQTPFLFFNKTLNEIEASGLSLVLISFDGPQLDMH